MSIRAFESFQSISNSPELGFHEIKRHHATRGKAGNKMRCLSPNGSVFSFAATDGISASLPAGGPGFQALDGWSLPCTPSQGRQWTGLSPRVMSTRRNIARAGRLFRAESVLLGKEPPRQHLPQGLLRKRSAGRKHGDAGLLFAPSLLVESSVLFGAK